MILSSHHKQQQTGEGGEEIKDAICCDDSDENKNYL